MLRKLILGFLTVASLLLTLTWVTTLETAKVFPTFWIEGEDFNPKVGDRLVTTVAGSGDLDFAYEAIVARGPNHVDGWEFLGVACWHEVPPHADGRYSVSVSHLTLQFWFLILLFGSYPTAIGVRRIYRWRYRAGRERSASQPTSESAAGSPLEPWTTLDIGKMSNQPTSAPKIVGMTILLAWCAVFAMCARWYFGPSAREWNYEALAELPGSALLAGVIGVPTAACCCPFAVLALRRKKLWQAMIVLFLLVGPPPTLFLVYRDAASLDGWKVLLGSILWFHIVCAILLNFLPNAVSKHPPGHCQSCGYNLTGLLSGRCPECGSAIPQGSDHRQSVG